METPQRIGMYPMPVCTEDELLERQTGKDILHEVRTIEANIESVHPVP